MVEHGIEFSKIDISPERRIIVNLLTSTEFLREFVEYPLVFKTEYARIVSKWALDYYREYERHPGKDIEHIFLNSRVLMDKDTIEAVGRFLQTVSLDNDKKKEFNLQYELDTAERYLQEQSLLQFQERLSQCMLQKDLKAADALIAKYNLPERGMGIGTDILWDEDIIKQMFADGDPYVLKYPGILGQVVSGLYPGEVSGFMARTGLGKTWWMIYTLLLAAAQGVPVLLVSLEMGIQDMMRRIWQSSLGRKAIHDLREDIVTPEFVSMDGLYHVRHNEISPLCLEREHVIESQKGLRYLWQGTQAKVWAYPTNTLTMSTLKNDLIRAEQREEFMPRLILIDYPMIMNQDGREEYRHRINTTWLELKQLASERNIAILGALQVTSDKLKPGQRPDLTSIPEAKTLSAHMAQLFALWTTKNDEGKGVMRASNLKSRHSEGARGDAVILYNHSIGQAYLDSKLASQVAF